MTTWRPARLSASERDPRPVADSLDRVTKSFGAPRAQLLSAVFTHWEELVGAEIAAHAQPRSLRDGVIVVSVDQPAWATQLRYMASDLLARIRTDTGSAEIVEIQIRVGSGPESEGRRKGRRWGPK
jgi:predicted nucleic acid-binding Zn ribbon protein